MKNKKTSSSSPNACVGNDGNQKLTGQQCTYLYITITTNHSLNDHNIIGILNQKLIFRERVEKEYYVRAKTQQTRRYLHHIIRILYTYICLIRDEGGLFTTATHKTNNHIVFVTHCF